MAAFPDVIGTSYQRSVMNPTTLVEAGQRYIWRYRKWTRPRHVFTLGWDLLAQSDASSIANCVEQQLGAYLTFYWFDWRSFPWQYVYIGTGDGSTHIYTLPAKSSSSQTIYVNGTVITDAIITAGGGTNGEDVIGFPSSPIAGGVITASFTGRRRFSVAFADDGQSVPRLIEPTDYYNFQTVLVEIK